MWRDIAGNHFAVLPAQRLQRERRAVARIAAGSERQESD
jgi:hypothetical protein